MSPSEENKKCIFHIPGHVDEKGSSGSQLRPRKMIEAFRNIGYEVDVVMGYGAERKKSIKRIKENIKDGVRYDFIYAENTTMPNILTEKDHLPRHPFLDYDFFKFCKRNGIRIGLFYRDIYWRTPVYKEHVSNLKYMAAIAAYRYELLQYKMTLDVLYLPTIEAREHFGTMLGCLDNKTDSLPPGGSVNEDFVAKKNEIYSRRKDEKKNRINLFYVGGLTGHYKCEKMFKAIYPLENVYLTVCCGKEHWEQAKMSYAPYMSERVNIIHKSSDELDEYYEKADICMAFFEPSEYRSTAMPIKIFEYISKGIPIISTAGNAYSTLIDHNDIGWNLDYSADELRSLIADLSDDYGVIYDKHTNVLKAMRQNTWEKRAEKVRDDLIQR